MNNSESIKALINNKAKADNINPQILLRNYMMERLLERISVSKYRPNFILKGGLLVANLVGVELRSTIDIDTTVKRYPLKKKTILKAFEEIISIDLDDQVFLK